MEKECELVQDLLLNYADGVLTDTSKEIVERHLAHCKKCQERLKDIQSDLEKEEKTQDAEIDYLKRIKKRINKKTMFIAIGVVLVVLIIIFNIMVFVNYTKTASVMEIFLEDTITDEQVENIKDAIEEVYSKSEIEYISKQQALENMKEKLPEAAYLLSGYEGDNNIFPASIIVKASVSKIDSIKQKVSSMDGVKTVTTNNNSNPYELFFMKIANPEIK